MRSYFWRMQASDSVLPATFGAATCFWPHSVLEHCWHYSSVWVEVKKEFGDSYNREANIYITALFINNPNIKLNHHEGMLLIGICRKLMSRVKIQISSVAHFVSLLSRNACWAQKHPMYVFIDACSDTPCPKWRINCLLNISKHSFAGDRHS